MFYYVYILYINDIGEQERSDEVRVHVQSSLCHLLLQLLHLHVLLHRGHAVLRRQGRVAPPGTESVFT